SYFFFAASFTMIIPELPGYLTSLGGEDYKGAIIGLFTLTAGLSRPFSGKLSDTVGRVPVMIFGTLVCVICSFLYPFLTSVYGFLLLRLLHGFSTGFKPTASSAYVADIVPIDRRGEAMGMAGVSMNTGAMIAPIFGSFLANEYSIDLMFYASSGMAFFSILILLGLKETLEDKQPFHPKILVIKKNEIYEKSAIAPAILVALLYFSYGTLLTITPDQSTYLGIENKGYILGVFTVFSIISRLIAGRVSDIYGRLIVIKVSGVLSGLAILLFGYADTVSFFYFAAALTGLALGISSPAVMAWTVDRAPDKHRGRAMATMYIALELGIGLGAFISSWIFSNEVENLPAVYFVTGACAWAGVIYLQFIFKDEKIA
ncbi:MAG: MFS family permease, partial [Saprospiraceae bacterium]